MTVPTRLSLAAIAPLLALLAVACTGGSDPTPAATATSTALPEVTSTPEAPPINILPAATATPPPPTPAPIPPAAATGIWVFDLARARQSPLYEGDALIEARLDGAGNPVTASVITDDGVTAIRFGVDGERIEEHPNRGLITAFANGESRFYVDLEDPEAPRLVLEHQGSEVRIEGTRPRVGLSFSPSGERLLALSERAGAAEGEVVRTFSVHSTVDGRLRMQFEHRALAGSPPVARWSPSSRYIADEGLAGLAVRDTVTGSAWLLGPGGSARWSPIADRLLAITLLGRLSVVEIPALTGVDLGVIDAAAFVQFDREGRLAIVATRAVEEGAEPSTTAFDVDTGSEVASWPGMSASELAIGGANPVITVSGEIAAVFTAGARCDQGFVVYHPELNDQGRCVEGASPRWSPNGQLLVYARGREIVLLSISSDMERIIASGTPPVDLDGGPLLQWSGDGSWILIQWPRGRKTDLDAAE